MNATRYLPSAILLAMLLAAAAAIGVGVWMARDEKTIVVEQDQVPLTDFASKLTSEVHSLESNFEKTLLTLRGQLHRGMSHHQLRSVGETYVGLQQICFVHPGRFRKKPTIEKTINIDGDLPPPILAMEKKPGLDLSPLDSAFIDHFWIKGQQGRHYFITRAADKRGGMLIFSIAETEIAHSMSKWLAQWQVKIREGLVIHEWTHQVLAPDGSEIASLGDLSNKPDLLFPIPSRFGNWKVKAWEKRITETSYHSPTLMIAGTVATLLALLGMGTFTFLRKSLKVAEQRVSFVNRVSHELRTPLTNIMLNLDLASEAVPENSKATRRFGLIREEISRLHRLLENVLSFSRQQHSSDQLTSIKLSLHEEVAQVLKQNEASLARHDITLESDLDEKLHILADPDAFAQILGNLISNVEKYSGQNSKVQISASEADDQITIRVVDSGSGISKKHREKIFRPFVRLNDRANEGSSGSGLGLAIARDLAARMNGTLICRERPDHQSGSCFELTLPSADQASENLLPFNSQAS